MLRFLRAVRDHGRLCHELALKGGAALHLFELDSPRLTRDLDLNFVGDVDVTELAAVKARVEKDIRTVCASVELAVDYVPPEHACGTWRCTYRSRTGRRRTLELDLVWLHRVPLWPLRSVDSIAVGTHRVSGVPALSIEEIAGGKIVALFDRSAPRDVFDVRAILDLPGIDLERVRLAAVVLSLGTRSLDLRACSPAVPPVTSGAMSDLLPLLSPPAAEAARDDPEWGAKILDECMTRLAGVLPLRARERGFLAAALDQRRLDAGLLDASADFRDRVERHPAVRWRVGNVARHLGSRADS